MKKTPSANRRKPSKGEGTRERILRSAIRLMARDGFYGTSVEQIAEAAGVSGTAPLYYFESKEHIIHGVLELILENNHRIVSSAMKPQLSALDRLRTHFRMNLRWASKFPEEASIELLMYYQASFQREWSALYGDMLRKGRERILELVLAGQREGKFARGLDARKASLLLHDALLGGLVAMVGSRPANSRAAAGLEERWEYLFRSLLLL